MVRESWTERCPDGKYTLITLHKKVTVLSGPKMTQNDINKFVSQLGDAHGGKKDSGASRKSSKGRMVPPRKAPAKFRGRVVHQGTTLGGSAVVRPAVAGPLKSIDRPRISIRVALRHAGHN